MRTQRFLPLLAILPLFLLVAPASGQWTVDGTKVLDDPGSIQAVAAAPDGEGGAYLALRVYNLAHAPYYFIVLRRVDGHGRQLFGPDGLDVDFASAGNRMSLALAADGGGHAFLGTNISTGSYYAIYLARIDDQGQNQWTRALAPSGMNLQYPQLAYDQERSLLFAAYTDTYTGALHLMKLDALTGVPLWTVPGPTVNPTTGALGTFKLIADGAGGCIVVWTDSRHGNLDLFAQRLQGDGALLWTAGGVPICDLASVPNNYNLIADGLGGVYTVWSDNRSGSERIYGQRVTAAGVEAWTADGLPICSTVSTQFEPVAAGDGQGGLLVAWRDYRSGYWALIASRLDRAGGALWNAAGETVCGLNSSKYGLALVADGAGGGVLAWHDFRGGNADIYAQRFAGDATLHWPADAVALCTDAAAQQNPLLVGDKAGGAVAIWKDPRGQPDDYFAQRVDRFGNWGFPAAVVQAVVDVPEDQGGRVVVGWDRSRFDDWSLNTITRYTLWRELDLAAAKGEPLADPELADRTGRPLRLDDAGKAGYWEQVGEVEAVASPGYAMTAPTLRDSTAADPGVIAFRVIAHGSLPGEYWVSLPRSGWSVDDLAPVAPSGLAGAASYEPAGLLLSWRPSGEADLVGYRLYRGPEADFTPDQGNLLAALADTALFDADGWIGSHYKLTAIDVHGNEGPWAALAPEMVTAATAAPPTATVLLGAAPNPFNPATSIGFVVGRTSRISLRLYDASGRLVRELVDRVYPPGRYGERWDGTDQAGRPVASGPYYCRLAGDGIVATRAVLLMK